VEISFERENKRVTEKHHEIKGAVCIFVSLA
jgi:hypothetical protein